MFGNYTRVFGFTQQVLASARKKPTLLAPLVMNIALAVPVNAILIVLSLFLPDGLAMLLMPVGLSALYFIDYFCGGLNTAMVYEEQTTGNATLGGALKRTLKSAVGIVVFAVVSGLLDFAVQILSDRRLHVLRPLLLMIRSFWSTATFVIMPSMIIEGLGFGAAFKRSKELAEKDPTQLGVGYIGMGLVTSLISMVGFLLVSFVGARILWPISPLLGLAFELVVVNATWAIAAYLKSTYYTCYYMWTRECERNGGVNPAYAPTPLRNVLADVDFRSMGIQLAPAAAAAAVAVAVAGAPAPAFAAQPGFGAPPPSGFAAAPQPQAFAPAPQGLGQPPPSQFGQPQPQFGQPPPQFGQPASQFGQPPPQFAQPQVQPQFPAPQPQPQFVAPQPQFVAPQPQPQFVAPAPQPQFAPAPQPQFAAPAPQPYPQPQVAPPAPRPYVAPAPPAPQPQFAPPQPRPSAPMPPAPQPYAQPQPRPPVPQPYPQPAPAAHATAPASRPIAPKVQPFAPTEAMEAFAPIEASELQGEATTVTASPFDDDEATRVG